MLCDSEYKNCFIIEKFFYKSDSGSEEKCVEFIIGSYVDENLNTEPIKAIKEKLCERVRLFRVKFQNYLKKNHYVYERVKSNHSVWLNSYFKIPVDLIRFQPSTSRQEAGRPPKKFHEKTKKSQHKEAALIATQGFCKLLLASYKAAKNKGWSDMAKLLQLLLLSKITPTEILELISNKENKIIKKTPEEALCVVLDNSLSKRQYNNIRSDLKISNCDIYPVYDHIPKAKIRCRPEGMNFTEVLAEVGIQNLLNHTTQRFLEVQKDVIQTAYKNSSKIHLKFIYSWGMDGCTGFSSYNQTWQEVGANNDDSSLFVTTLNPLRLYDTGEPKNIVWNNSVPQSIKFCRPICMKFQKESADVIQFEKERFDEQIKRVKNMEITCDDKRISIEYELIFSLIDGKVLSVVTGTKSIQMCPICKQPSKEFNSIENFKNEKFKPIR